jgi:ferredoxin
VSIQDTNQTIEIPSDSILYDALADQGVDLPHGCLSGSCGACRIDVISGADKLNPPGVIETNTIEAICDEYSKTLGPQFLEGKNIRLSCRAKVCGDITILPLARK